MVYDAAVLRNLDTLQPFRKAFRYILLEESRAPDAAVETLHSDGTAADVRKNHRRNRFVVRRQLTLSNPFSGKQHLLRMCDQAISFAGNVESADYADFPN